MGLNPFHIVSSGYRRKFFLAVEGLSQSEEPPHELFVYSMRKVGTYQYSFVKRVGKFLWEVAVYPGGNGIYQLMEKTTNWVSSV